MITERKRDNTYTKTADIRERNQFVCGGQERFAKKFCYLINPVLTVN